MMASIGYTISRKPSFDTSLDKLISNPKLSPIPVIALKNSSNFEPCEDVKGSLMNSKAVHIYSRTVLKIVCREVEAKRYEQAADFLRKAYPSRLADPYYFALANLIINRNNEG